MSFWEPPSSRTSYFTIALRCIRNSKNYPRNFWTTLTKRAFLLVIGFTQKPFSSSPDPHPLIHHINNWLTCWSRTRTQVGSAESLWRSWRSSGSSPGVFQIQKNWNILVLLSQLQNDETSKRRIDKRQTTKLARNAWFVDGSHSGTVPVRKRSFFVSNASFVVLSFRSPVASKT